MLEALKAGPISGEVRLEKVPQMTRIPAKVLTVDGQSHQYRILVQIGYLGSFQTLRFGESKPFSGACHKGRLDLFYDRDPGLKAGEPFPL